MSAGDVTLLAPISIRGDDTKAIARARSILNGFGVMSTTNRDLISAEVKAGGYVVYNTTTSQLEWWNGSSWVAISSGSGGGLNSVTTVATSNQATLTGLAQTINGVALNTDGMTVLLTAQSTASQNGPWIVHSGAWTRPTYFATGNDAAGVLIVVQQGSALADTAWLCSTNSGSAVVGTNNLTFIEVTEAGITIADEVTLTKSGLTYSIKAGGVGNTQLASGIAWSKLATAIGNLGFTGLKYLTYTLVANGTVGATPTIDLTAGTDHTLTLGANTTLAFTAPPAGTRFRLSVTEGSSPWTLAFPGSVVWVGNPRRLGTGSGEVTYFEGEYNGTNYVMDGDIPSRLAPRGSTDVEIDLYPAVAPASATLAASGGTVVVDFPLVAGKWYSISWRIAVGPASGQVAFLETDLVHAQLVSGAAAILKYDVTSQLALANLSVAFTTSTTNLRMTLTNASATAYKATVQAGAIVSNLPS